MFHSSVARLGAVILISVLEAQTQGEWAEGDALSLHRSQAKMYLWYDEDPCRQYTAAGTGVGNIRPPVFIASVDPSFSVHVARWEVYCSEMCTIYHFKIADYVWFFS